MSCNRSLRPPTSFLVLACVASLVLADLALAQFQVRQPTAVESRPRIEASPAVSTAKSLPGRDLSDRPAARDATSRDAEFAALARDAAQLEAFTSVIKRSVQFAKPSVVHIESYRVEHHTGGYGRGREIEEAGSGVVVEVRGRYFVVTNQHVVEGAKLDDIHIRSSQGQRLRPRAYLHDASTDLAVLELQDDQVTPARMGNSDTIEIGEIVLAIGSPFGLNHSVSYGIISAKGRRDLELGRDGVRFQDFLQTDAAINPGNSGGPLVNLRGEVIGISTAIASSSGGNDGIGFAIPSNMVMLVVRQLIETGSVAHAYLGVTLDNDFNRDEARRIGVPGNAGALVKSITPQSPASLARIRPNDIITQFNGVSVENDSHLVNLVGLTTPDRAVDMRVYREGKILTFSVQLEHRRRYDDR